MVVLVSLIGADTALAIAFFRPFLPGPGPLVMGDLPAMYTYNGLEPHWLLTLSLYQSTEQGFSLLVPWTAVHNALYCASFLIPSLGMYYFLSLFTRYKSIAGLIAFSTGTIVNPVFISNFYRGGEEYGLWLFFTFLGFALLAAPILKASSRWWQSIAAGIFFGLSSSQTYGLTGFGTAAVVLTGPPLVGLLLYRIFRDWHDPPTRGRTISEVVTFFMAYGTLLIPLVLLDVSQASTVLGSTGQSGFVVAHAVANARYTFSPYGFAEALLTLPPTPTQIGYSVVLIPAWAAIVVISLIGASANFVSNRGPLKWISGVFLLSYLGWAAIIAGVNSGLLLPAYQYFPPLDLWDAPNLFVYAELVCIPFMFLSFFLYLSDLPVRLSSTANPPVSASSSTPRRSSQSLSSRFVRPNHLLARGSALAVISVVILALALLLWAIPTDQMLKTDMFQNPAIGTNSPFASSSILSLRHWYASVSSSVSGYVLPLPDDYLSYNAVQGVVPISRLWVIPLHTSQIVAGYNDSSYVLMMDSLANGSVDLWAAQIAMAGVQYVALMHTSPSVTLVPSYVPNAPGLVPYPELEAELAKCPALELSFDSGGVLVFRNQLYDGPGYASPGLSTFGLSPPASSAAVGPGLPPQGFLSWNTWPAHTVTTFPNGSAAIAVNPSVQPGYVVLWATLLNESDRGPLNGTLNQSVELSSSYSQTSYSFSDRILIANGTHLQAWVGWYNTTNPSRLYGYSTFTKLGTFFSGIHDVEVTLPVPVGTVMGRVFYVAFPDANTTAGSMFALSPNAERDVSWGNLSTDGNAELAISRTLVQTGILANGTLFLANPENRLLKPLFPEGASVCSIVPAGAVDPAGNRSFSISVSATTFPDLTDASGVPFAQLVVMGNTSETGPAASLLATFENSSITKRLTSGNFAQAFRLPSSVLGKTVTIAVEGNLTLALFALSLSVPLQGNSVSIHVSLELPIGDLSGVLTSFGFTILQRGEVQLGRSSHLLPSDFVPIPALTLLAVGVYLIRSRGRRNRKHELHRETAS